jgi:uncharacterized membrane protein
MLFAAITAFAVGLVQLAAPKGIAGASTFLPARIMYAVAFGP